MIYYFKGKGVYMLHEFTVQMSLQQVDEATEKLISYGYYNLYYDQPFEQFREENGYGFQEVMDSNIDLKIFLEDIESFDMEKTKEEISAILAVPKDTIVYQLIETEEWQQPFPVIDLQNGWFLKPTSNEEEVEGKLIHFEPPSAFGSGLHVTDCLRIILREDMSGKRVLDLGTGAGLLSVAAALGGARDVLAVDIEDVESEVLYNARLNKVENYITVFQGDVVQPSFEVQGLFDWILVNIVANEIKQLASFLDTHLTPNGMLLLSGMVDWHHQETLALFQEKGYKTIQILQTEEWVTALVTKEK